MRDAPVQPGEILAGKYRVERVLGYGAMGVVVAATHLGLGRAVALKFMLRRGPSSAERRARFEREARIAAMLKSPHVASVLDVGTLDDGAPYIVMELLAGQDLARLLRARGPLPVGEAVRYVAEACDALAEAHAAGIVHRDLKPANLFLTDGPGGARAVKVLDFGISKLIESDVELTRTGDAMGSPLYMAPEQMRSARDVDGRADLWSLAVILYELLTGRTPIQAETVMMLMHRLVHDPPTPIGQLRGDLPGPLADAIHRALEKDRAARFTDVASFATAIAPYAEVVPRPILPSVGAFSLGGAPASVPPAPGPILGPPPREPLASTGLSALSSSAHLPAVASARRRPRAAWIAAAAVGVGLIGTLAALSRGPAAPATVAAPTIPPAPTASAPPAPLPPPPGPLPPTASASVSPAPAEAPSASAPEAKSAAAPSPAAPPPPKASSRPTARPPKAVDYDQR